ncbi:unnamed protein product [Protopolystoma xenopodis]|uniref:Uncharacterized protein n=1 Tax=Protopolystoma xenopodis TaxID=117903 RepID=A0A3S5AB15_9PLAT|nr:unnamed protein product [Protopolystoma xenopodis]
MPMYLTQARSPPQSAGQPRESQEPTNNESRLVDLSPHRDLLLRQLASSLTAYAPDVEVSAKVGDASGQVQASNLPAPGYAAVGVKMGVAKDGNHHGEPHLEVPLSAMFTDPLPKMGSRDTVSYFDSTLACREDLLINPPVSKPGALLLDDAFTTVPVAITTGGQGFAETHCRTNQESTCKRKQNSELDRMAEADTKRQSVSETGRSQTEPRSCETRNAWHRLRTRRAGRKHKRFSAKSTWICGFSSWQKNRESGSTRTKGSTSRTIYQSQAIADASRCRSQNKIAENTEKSEKTGLEFEDSRRGEMLHEAGGDEKEKNKAEEDGSWDFGAKHEVDNRANTVSKSFAQLKASKSLADICGVKVVLCLPNSREGTDKGVMRSEVESARHGAKANEPFKRKLDDEKSIETKPAQEVHERSRPHQKDGQSSTEEAKLSEARYKTSDVRGFGGRGDVVANKAKHSVAAKKSREEEEEKAGKTMTTVKLLTKRPSEICQDDTDGDSRVQYTIRHFLS